MIVSPEGDGRARLGVLTTEKADQIVMFGADWCGDCRRARSWLRRHDVPYTMIDTDADPEAKAHAATLAGGRPNIPVLLAPDGTVLVEPTAGELASTLAGYRRRADRARCR